jgi:glutaredoxin
MPYTTVPGRKAAGVLLFALSTCPWCRKTKELLNSLGVEYRYIDVDLATGEERDEAVAAVKKWNPPMSLPILVIDNERAIIGFRPDDIQAALGQ